MFNSVGLKGYQRETTPFEGPYFVQRKVVANKSGTRSGGVGNSKHGKGGCFQE